VQFDTLRNFIHSSEKKSSLLSFLLHDDTVDNDLAVGKNPHTSIHSSHQTKRKTKEYLSVQNQPLLSDAMQQSSFPSKEVVFSLSAAFFFNKLRAAKY
jgi:hypothetical protein